MADLGKILYEMHCANVKRLRPDFQTYLAEWFELDATARQAWNESAAEFLQHFDEGE